MGQTRHHLADTIRVQTTLKLHACTTDYNRQGHRPHRKTQSNTSNIYRPLRSIRHRITHKNHKQAKTRIQLPTRNTTIFCLVLSKPQTITTYPKRTITDTNYHTWYSTRKHPLHHFFPTIHKQHNPHSTKLISVHIRRRHNLNHHSKHTARTADFSADRTPQPHYLFPQQQSSP